MKTFDLNKEVSHYLNEKSDYTDFNRYFVFLISNMDEISKSHSGVMKIIFPPVYSDCGILVELYGYDTLTMSSVEKIKGTEKEVKKEMINLFEKERNELLEQKE